MASGLRLRGDDSAAFAANWRTVLAVDLGMGLVVLVGGLVVLVVAGSGWGWMLVVVGFVYLFFAGGRAVRWARLRRDGEGAPPRP